MELRDRTVVLTGASGGIGTALALELCAEGARVVAVGRREAELARLTALAPPGRLQPLLANINEADARERIAAAAAEHGGAQLLIHAAALSGFGLFAAGSEAADRQLFETNVLAPMALTRRLLPQLEAQPQAAVVAVGSTFGSLAFPGFATYSASKFALRGLFEALAREYADRPLRFLWLAPRATATAFNSAAVQALNSALGSAVDAPQAVAVALLKAIRREQPRLQLGWPEKLLVRLNGCLPGLIDRGLRGKLALLRRHARPPVSATAEGVSR